MNASSRVVAALAAVVIACPQALASAAPRSLDYTAGSVPGMGVSVFEDEASGQSKQCTIGWPIRDNAGNPGFLTAGHCVVKNPVSAPYMYTDANDPSKRFFFDPYSHAARGVANNGVQFDTAVFYLTDATTPRRLEVKKTTGETIRVKSVMPREQALKLQPGTSICQAGSRSGVVCGPLIKADEDSLRWGGLAVAGDSGSAVFTVDGDGEAIALGVLSYGGSDYDNTAVYLEPILSSWGLSLDK